LSSTPEKQKLLAEWPIELPKDYLVFVNTPMAKEEEEAIRYSVNRGKPFGSSEWTGEIVERFKLEATIRNRGRQIKGT
jgi:putative transposase